MKKKYTYLALGILTILFGGYLVNKYTGLFKEVELTLTLPSENIGKYLEGDVINYDTTKDLNVKFLIKKYLAKDAEEIYYNEFRVFYYNQDVFLGGSGFYWNEFNLFDIKTGEKINKNCSINSNEGFMKFDNVLISGYPFHRDEDRSQQDVCIYEIGSQNFQLIQLTDKLKNGEILTKYFALEGGVSVYKIDTVRKEITVSIFDADKKDQEGMQQYVRDIVVAY